MTREAYHRALKNVQDDVMNMAGMVSKALKDSMEALKHRDFETSKRIIDDDNLINRKRFDIEEKCLLLIATQQPMAVDLRVLAAVINIITDLERIGDHAEGIAKINISIGDEPLVKPLRDIPQMSELGLSMLDRCMKRQPDRYVMTTMRLMPSMIRLTGSYSL